MMKSENWLKISFIIFWNSEGAFLRPKGITFRRANYVYYKLTWS